MTAPFWKVAVACIIVQIGFGVYPVVVKWFAQEAEFNMAVFSFYRDLFCSPLLFCAAKLIEGNNRVPLPRSREEILTFLLLGATGIGGQQLCFILGVYYSTATNASIFQNTIPVWATGFSILFKQESAPSLSEKHGVMKILGFACAIGGAIVMNAAKEGAGSSKLATSPFVGTLFLIANTGMTGFFLAMQKKRIFNADEKSPGRLAFWKMYPVHVTAFCYAFGTLVASVACLIGAVLQLDLLQFGRDQPTATWKLPSTAIPPLVYAILVPSALSYGLISFANKNAPSSLVSAFWPFQVPVAVFLSYIAGLGSLTFLQVVGGLFIISGLLLVSFAAYRQGISVRVPEGYAPVGESFDQDEDIVVEDL